jgi:hypothetical protein
VAETSWPTVAGARAVTDDQWELMSAAFAADGVQGAWTSSSPVFGDSSGRQVKVRSAQLAVVGGHGYSSGTSDTIKSISANSSGSTRIDMVVLGLSRTTWAVTSYVKTGTPGAGAPPALTRNARGGSTGVWEIPLAMVTVVNGAATIAAGDVTNIAWYSRGETVATSSATPPQPDAASYSRMMHTDTGHEFDSVSGAWRRSPWQVSRGVVGGKRYNANAIIAAGISTSESVLNMNSGSVVLEANRRFRLQSNLRLQAASSNTYFIYRLRETDLFGTIVGYAEQFITGSGAPHNFTFEDEIATSSSITRTYVPTLQRIGGGNLTAFTGATFLTCGVWVIDVGPSAPDVVTIVP